MPHLILENKNLILFLNLKFNFMKRRGLIFNSRPNKTVCVCVRINAGTMSCYTGHGLLIMRMNDSQVVATGS